MLRLFYISIFSLWLSGCGSIPWLESDNAERPPAGAPGDNPCATLAEQRAKDASYNGYDRDLQKQIYDYTYSECVAGKKKSGH